MSREATIARLEQEWQSLLAAMTEVSEDRLLEGGATGAWSVRDLLTHIATWEREFLKALPLILEGKRLPHYSTLYGGINAFNAGEQDRTRALSVIEARQALNDSHTHLLDKLSGLSALAPKVEERMRRRLRQDTTHHYREHAAQILAWNKQASGDSPKSR